MRKAAREAGLTLEIDSAGTAHWHTGKPPDLRAQSVAQRYGADISGLRARQINAQDFNRFSHIYALDHDNLRDIGTLAPARSAAEISLLLDCVPGREGSAVADPYYGGEEHFEETWKDVTLAAAELVRRFSSWPSAR